MVTEPVNYSGLIISPCEAANRVPNSRVRVIEAGNKNNNFGYEFNVFCDSDSKNINKNSLSICLYDYMWYWIKKYQDEVQIVALLPHVHNFNLDDPFEQALITTTSTSALLNLTSPIQSESILLITTSSLLESSISSTSSVNQTIWNTSAVLSTANSPKVSTLTQLPTMATTTTS